MADEMKLALAQKVYQTICDELDGRNWKYAKTIEDDKLMVDFGVNTDDFSVKYYLFVDIERQILRLYSPLPFKMSEKMRLEGAVATCAVTYKLAVGNFDYDVSDGEISFRMSNCFSESEIGRGLIAFMIDCTYAMVDKYNDMFFALDKGVYSLSDFLAKL